jgi:hypothetical protein
MARPRRRATSRPRSHWRRRRFAGGWDGAIQGPRCGQVLGDAGELSKSRESAGQAAAGFRPRAQVRLRGSGPSGLPFETRTENHTGIWWLEWRPGRSVGLARATTQLSSSPFRGREERAGREALAVGLGPPFAFFLVRGFPFRGSGGPFPSTGTLATAPQCFADGENTASSVAASSARFSQVSSSPGPAPAIRLRTLAGSTRNRRSST